MLAWSLDAFAAAGVARAVVAAPPDRLEAVRELAPSGLELAVVAGGATRAESVGGALAEVETELVAVHDAARPLVTAELIATLIERLSGESLAAGVIAAAPVAETLKRVGEGMTVEATVDRERLWAAQTPQVFRAEALRAAHAARAAEDAATDDAVLVERAGGAVLVEAARTANLKVTTAADLRLAELLLGARG